MHVHARFQDMLWVHYVHADLHKLFQNQAFLDMVVLWWVLPSSDC